MSKLDVLINDDIINEKEMRIEDEEKSSSLNLADPNCK